MRSDLIANPEAIPDEYKVDHLILLVGGNPLPNAIASCLLLKREGIISLLRTPDSGDVARHLKQWLTKHQLCRGEIREAEIPEADPEKIIRSVHDLLSQVPDAKSAGIHYTSGTKAMSVHAYRTTVYFCENVKRIPCVASYLNAGSLMMVMERYDENQAYKPLEKYVGDAVNLGLKEDLIPLHGWKLRIGSLHLKPVFPLTSRAIVRLIGAGETYEKGEYQHLSDDWSKFRNYKFKKRCQKGYAWKSIDELDKQGIPWPEDHSLSIIENALKRELRQEDAPKISFAQLAENQDSFVEIEPEKRKDEFCDWLNGKWLEDFTFSELLAIKDDARLHDCGWSVETEPIDRTYFEVDVVAMRGYQLFVFSCSNAYKRKELKGKLFEAYLRAKQLGGDEARVALVCLSPEPELIEREVRRDIDPKRSDKNKKIRVFGWENLSNLSDEIAKWVKRVSDETGEGDG